MLLIPSTLILNRYHLLKTRIVDSNDIGDIKKNVFSGFKPVRELWTDKSSIPKIKGIYLVINPIFKKTVYISPGVGGFFKGKGTNILIAKLKCNHVDNSQVVYIGKAENSTGQAILNSRLG